MISAQDGLLAIYLVAALAVQERQS